MGNLEMGRLWPSKEERHFYSSTLLSSAADVSRWCDADSAWSDGNVKSHARFFLASVSERHWLPRMVVVRREGVMMGVLYAKERLLAGVPTGIIYSDGILSPAVDAEPIHRYFVLDA